MIAHTQDETVQTMRSYLPMLKEPKVVTLEMRLYEKLMITKKSLDLFTRLVVHQN